MPTIFESKKKIVSIPPVPVSMGLLTCFAVNPTGVRFETQEDGELIVLFLRQHIIVNLPWVVSAILLALIPPIFVPLLISATGITLTIPFSYMLVGTLFWYLALFGFVLAKFLGWFFNIYIVTNERVIDIDFFYLLYKKFSQAELNKIQDISYSSGGIIATMFNYGNVIVETAGESPNLEFDRVPYPDKVVETIRNLAENGEKTV